MNLYTTTTPHLQCDKGIHDSSDFDQAMMPSYSSTTLVRLPRHPNGTQTCHRGDQGPMYFCKRAYKRQSSIVQIVQVRTSPQGQLPASHSIMSIGLMIAEGSYSRA